MARFLRLTRLKLGALVAVGLAISGCIPKDSNIASTLLASGSNKTTSFFAGAITAENLDSTRVKVSWNLSTSPVSNYVVYSVSPGGALTGLRTVPSSVSSTIISGLTPNTIYNFRVVATSSIGLSDTNTNDKMAYTFAGATSASTIDSTSGSITFPALSLGQADFLNVYCSTVSKSYGTTPVASITNISQTSVTISKTSDGSNLVSGTVYYCKVTASFYGLEDNNTSEVSFTPVGSATNLAISFSPGGTTGSTSITAGTPFTIGPIVKILDSKGNVVSAGPDSTASITLSISPTAATLVNPNTFAQSLISGTGASLGVITIAAVNGVADFSSYGVNLTTAGLTKLRAHKSSTAGMTMGTLVGTAAMDIDSRAFTVNPAAIAPAPASTVTVPASIVAGDTGTISILLSDAYGNRINNQSTSIISSRGTILDSITQASAPTASDGTASGSISSTTVGSVTISVALPGLTLTAATQILAGTPSQFIFNSASGAGIIPDSVAGQTIPSFTVALADANGNVITSFAGPYYVCISKNFGLGAISSAGTTLIANLATAGANGLGTFSNVVIDTAGTYKLAASNNCSINAGIITQGTPSISTAVPNTFRVATAGTQKLVISGANGLTSPYTTPDTTYSSSVASGTCSSTFYIYAEDNSGNRIKQTTSDLQLSFVDTTGVDTIGNGKLYTEGCTTLVTAANFKIASGQVGAKFAIKNSVAETLNLIVRAGGFTSGPTAAVVSFKPTSYKLTFGGSTAPAKSNQLAAGKCILTNVTAYGSDNNPGTVDQDTNFNINLSGVNGGTYSDPSCTSPITSGSVKIPSGASSAAIYVWDDTPEVLTLTLTNQSGGPSPNSLTLTLSPFNSKISGAATTIPSGPGITATSCKNFRLALMGGAKSGSASEVSVGWANALQISGNKSAQIYTQKNCAGAVSADNKITILANATFADFSIIDAKAEVLTLKATDTVNNYVGISDPLTVTVGAYTLSMENTGASGFVPGTSTSSCSAAINVTAIDAQATPAVVSQSNYRVKYQISGSVTNTPRLYTTAGCQGTAIANSGYLYLNGTNPNQYYISDSNTELVTFQVLDEANFLKQTSTAINFATPAITTFKGWYSIAAVGNRVPLSGSLTGTKTSMSPVAGYISLTWNKPTLSAGTIDGYNIYRGTSAVSFDLGALNGITPIAAGSTTTTYTTPLTSSDEGLVYYFKVVPIVNGIEAPFTLETSDAVVAVPVPPRNMALVHRWSANAETCRLMGKTSDRSSSYRCPYVGPGSSIANYFDLGYSYFMDQVEVGCNYSPSPHCPLSSTGGCIGDLAGTGSLPPTNIGQAEGDVFFDSNFGQCFVYSSGAWQTMTVSTIAAMSANTPGLPPIVAGFQTLGQASCTSDSNKAGSYYTTTMPSMYNVNKRLPNRKEQVLAAAWPKAGYSNCNQAIMNGGVFSSVDRVISPSSPWTNAALTYRTGSTSTNGCTSLYGIQDLLGNMDEVSGERMTISNSADYAKATTLAAPYNDFTSNINTASPIGYGFDGVTGPNCPYTNYILNLAAGSCANNDTGALGSALLGQFNVPLGLPLVAAADAKWGGVSSATFTASGYFGTDLMATLPRTAVAAPSVPIAGGANYSGNWSPTFGGSYYYSQQLYTVDSYFRGNYTKYEVAGSVANGRYTMGWTPATFNDINRVYDIGFRCVAPVPAAADGVSY